MNNFQKRKLKAAQVAVSGAEPEVVLDRHALDVTQVDGQYVFVSIKYNIDTGDAEVVATKPTTRAIGLGFDVKKRGLISLNKIIKE